MLSLVMGEIGEQGNVSVNLFRPVLNPCFTRRGIEQVDAWNWRVWDREGKPVRFDDFFESQLQRLKEKGERELVFFDLGSGEGNLLSDLLTESPFFRKSRIFLINNPDFTIKAIGLTDAPTVGDFNKEKPLISSGTISDIGGLVNKRIDAHNYYWSLSVRQKLSDFLDNKNIDKLDLIYATESLGYFSPLLFKEVMETIVLRMKSGSKMVASSVSTSNHLGFVNGKFDRFSDMSNDHQRSWKDLMRECVEKPEGGSDEMIKSLAEIDHLELQKEFDEVKGIYIKLGALTEHEIAASSYYFSQMSRGLNSEEKEEIFRKSVYEVLKRGFLNLENKSRIKDGDKKERVLDSLSDVNIERLEDGGFILTKI